MVQPLRTFDVFDTALSRMVGDPTAVFHVLGQHAVQAGWWRQDAAHFAAARIAAEGVARAHAHPKEVTLQDIYHQLAFAYGMDDAAASACVARELELEYELLWAVPQAERQLLEARAAKERVGFVSDTYLPHSTLERWLLALQISRPGEPLWVSSESGDRKADGSLFRHIAKQEGKVGSWRHTGDHPLSDVAIPRSMGVETRHFTDCLPTRYESVMKADGAFTHGLASMLAGTARWLRLCHPARSESQENLRDLAAGIAGPVLCAFVIWVLRQAQRDGIRTLWFAARDGQVLLRIARRIAPRLGLDLSFGYLYANRQLVNLAGLQRVDDHALGWLTGGAGILPLDAVLERAELRIDDVAGAVTRHGLPRTGRLGWERMEALNCFFRDEEVQAAVLERAKVRYEVMRAYYRSCGLIDGERCAIVDVGWRGNVLRSLFNIIGGEQGARHRFLYFGLYGRPADLRHADMSAFCFDISGDRRFGLGHDVPSLTAVIEIFCQADHAPALSIERGNAGFTPRLRVEAPAPVANWDVSYFQDCLERYASVLRLDLMTDVDGDLRSMCDRLLRLLMASPSAREARILGSVQFVDDQSGTTAQPFAEAYRWYDWRASLRAGGLPQKTLAWWTEGAWTMTPAWVRLLLRAARCIGRTRVRIA